MEQRLLDGPSMAVWQQNEKPTANGLAETPKDGVCSGQLHPMTLPDKTVELLSKRVKIGEVIAIQAGLIMNIY